MNVYFKRTKGLRTYTQSKSVYSPQRIYINIMCCIYSMNADKHQRRRVKSSLNMNGEV